MCAVNEDAKLVEIGNLEYNPDGDGAIGFRLKTREDRIITVRGLTQRECKTIAKFLGDVVMLDLRVAD